MASSRTIASRLSPRLSYLSPNQLTKPSPSLSQLPSSTRVPRSISRGVDRCHVADAAAQCNRFLANAVKPRRRVLELGFSSSRLVDAFMTFCCCCPVDDAEVFC